MTDNAEKILDDLANQRCSKEEASKRLNAIKDENKNTITYKISPKGAISFYGIRRMPITLYSEELDKIIKITNTPEYNSFIDENKSKISVKNK